MEYYQLKKGVESFQVVDGPFENKKFFRGDLYRKEEIPPEERGRFEKIEEKPATATENNIETTTDKKVRKAEGEKVGSSS